MLYKLLYIEDQPADSIKDDLSRQGFLVDVDNADDFQSAISKIGASNFDAYLMDFRLTANKGIVDAPTYASTIRTFGRNHKNKPIVLISNERNLSEFENDFTSQDLFDFVVSKEDFRGNLNKYCNRIKSIIEGYQEIEKDNYDIIKILNLDDENILDNRLQDKLEVFSKRRDVYGYCRLIYYSIIRSSGMLIGEDILAARLGIDKSCSDFSSFLDKISECKYSGILSSSYNRWWFYKVLKFWEKISDGKSLRRLKAVDRVQIINSALGLNLISASPLELSTSTTFWTICSKTLKPLDPSEGYVYNHKQLEVWQEQEYISLFAGLEYPELLEYLSPTDKREIIEFGNNAKA